MCKGREDKVLFSTLWFCVCSENSGQRIVLSTLLWGALRKNPADAELLTMSLLWKKAFLPPFLWFEQQAAATRACAFFFKGALRESREKNLVRCFRKCAFPRRLRKKPCPLLPAAALCPAHFAPAGLLPEMCIRERRKSAPGRSRPHRAADKNWNFFEKCHEIQL